MITPLVGKLDYQRMSSILEAGQQIISVSGTADILRMSNQDAAKLLSRLATAGLLKRVKRGLYFSMFQQRDSMSVKDSWLLAQNLFNPCYIGGYSAAKHWGLVEEGGDRTLVLTTNKPRNHFPVIEGRQFLLRTIPLEAMFGTQSVGCGSANALLSDPEKTIVDTLLDPRLGGGTIVDVTRMLVRYLKSSYRNTEQLYDYAKQLRSGAVLKRLGYLLSQVAPNEDNIINWCRLLKSEGYIKLDPQLGGDKLITRFGLWIPKDFDERIREILFN